MTLIFKNKRTTEMKIKSYIFMDTNDSQNLSFGDSGCRVNEEDLEIENITTGVTIVVCGIGVLFNLLNVIVSINKPVKGSVYIYVIALSIIDGLYCVTVIPTRSFRCGRECLNPPLEAQIYESFIYLPLGNILVCADIFLTVIWSVHRLTFIYKPKIIQDSRKIPLQAALVSVSLSFILHIPFFLKRMVINGSVVRTFYGRSDIGLHYDTALMIITKAIPILMLLIANMLLIISVNHAARRRAKLLEQSSCQVKDNYHQGRITCLLIAIVGLMLVGNIPVTISHAEFSEVIFSRKGKCLEAFKPYRVFRAVANILEQIAFSFNFIIYFAVNENFKKFFSQYCFKLCKLFKTHAQQEQNTDGHHNEANTAETPQ